MKLIDDHSFRYSKKDDTELLLRFIYGLGDHVFLKENKQTKLNHNDGRYYYKNKGKNYKKKKEKKATATSYL